MPRLLLITLVLAACHDVPGVDCPDGTICPDGTTCSVISGLTHCLTDEQRTQCEGAADETPCAFTAGEPSSGLCNSGACLRLGCGDGFVTGAEQCDGANLDEHPDCRSVGYYEPGVLACRSDCTFDRTGCELPGNGKCGDGVRNGDEQCDGPDLGEGNTCITAGGFYGVGNLGCNAACRFDFEGCKAAGRCGDGVLDAVEECDGGGETPLFAAGFDDCSDPDLGFYRSVPITHCNANCRIDRADCATAGSCGDGVADLANNEQCDGGDLGLAEVSGDGVIDCRDLEAVPGKRFYQGTLACTPNCGRDITQCQGFCGDGIKNADEVCDRLDLGTLTCGAYLGNLGCNAACTAITGGCFGSFGDGVINGNERCDGENFGGLTCAAFGFNLGATGLACNNGAIDATGCQANGYCGDGEINGNEECDGADTGGLDCSVVQGDGAVDCDENCRVGTSTCARSFWTRLAVPNPQGFIQRFQDAYSQNASSLWLLTQAQEIWQWDGTRWHERSANAPFNARAITGLGEQLWIATPDGEIYRWDWERFLPAALTGAWSFEFRIQAIVYALFSDGTTLYAATNDGIYERRSDGTWEQVIPGMFYAIDGRDGILIAVGEVLGEHNAARRERDGTWQPLAIRVRDRQDLKNLRTVRVLSRDQAVVTLGGFGGGFERPQPEFSNAFYWNGLEAWQLGNQSLPVGLFAVDAVAGESDDFWILNAGFTQTGGSEMRMFHHSGFTGFEQSVQVPVPLVIGDARETRIIGSDPGNLWILGDGAVAHFQGTGWRALDLRSARDLDAPNVNGVMVDVTNTTFSSIAALGDTVWMAGSCTPGNSCFDNRTLLEHRRTGVALDNSVPRNVGRLSDFGEPITGLAIDAAGWVWAARTTEIKPVFNLFGASGPPAGLDQVTNPDLREISAVWSAGDRIVVAFERAPFQTSAIAFHDASGWTIEIPSCPGPLFDPCALINVQAIGGTGPDDVWVVSGNEVTRWNGSSWRAGFLGSFDPIEATGIWVAGPNEAWVSKADLQLTRGAAIHVLWSPADEITATEVLVEGATSPALAAVWGSSSHDVWFGGPGAQALHWDGARLGRFTLPHGGIKAIGGTGPRDVWAVGTGVPLRFSQQQPETTAGACANAIPIYCVDGPVTVSGTIGAAPVSYRLISPISLGAVATASVDVAVTGIGGGVGVEHREARAELGAVDSTPSWCIPPFPPDLPPRTAVSASLVRGDWEYFTVRNLETQPTAYTLTFECKLNP